ncbi:hypothetical protein [Kribbella deserti]|uniref:DUF3592 domain-containing protein n=1 Tax=Kribbella deserti TaxID=1926257 RepID=A0ABV6QHW7_9ACTN
MGFLVIAVCCVAAGLVGRALAGPERWQKKVRAHVRPDAAEPTEDGYRWLFWWHWAVAALAVVVAVVGVDHVRLSEEELYEAAQRGVGSLDGTIGLVTSDRIDSAVSGLVYADLHVREISSSDSKAPRRYEITPLLSKGDYDDHPDRIAVCVQARISEGTDAGFVYSYTSTSPGRCEG